MVPPPFTEATTTRDPLYNGDSFISMNSRLDPFLNFSARCFLNDSTIGNMCRSTMDIGSRGNHGLISHNTSSIPGSCESNPEFVRMTVTELEENLKEGMMAAGGSSKKNLVHAKVSLRNPWAFVILCLSALL
ncbi:hypothetical protein WN943_000922 [Citrus x changshan-huyou]